MANLLISIDDFKEICGISDSFDANYIEPMIVQATDLAAQQVIGTALTIKIRTDYNAGSLAGLYQDLWDSDKCSFKKLLAWQTLQLCLPRMLYKIGAETISTGDTTEVESISSEELALLNRNADATRVLYENRVKKFLTENKDSIPELQDDTPEYLKSKTSESDTSMGLTFSPDIRYTNF